MDNKYGQLFTRHDMLAFAHIVAGSGIDLANSKGIEQMLEEFNGKFPRDEPLFLVRAKDNQALACVRNYRTMTAYSRGKEPDPGLLEGLNATVTQFDEFRLAHPERMKDAD